MWMSKSPSGLMSRTASGAKKEAMPSGVVHDFHTASGAAFTTTSFWMLRSCAAAGSASAATAHHMAIAFMGSPFSAFLDHGLQLLQAVLVVLPDHSVEEGHEPPHHRVLADVALVGPRDARRIAVGRERERAGG